MPSPHLRVMDAPCLPCALGPRARRDWCIIKVRKHEQDGARSLKRRWREPREAPLQLNTSLHQRRCAGRRKAELDLGEQADEVASDRLRGLGPRLTGVLDGVGVDAELAISRRLDVGEVMCTDLAVSCPAAWSRRHVPVDGTVDAGHRRATANA